MVHRLIGFSLDRTETQRYWRQPHTPALLSGESGLSSMKTQLYIPWMVDRDRGEVGGGSFQNMYSGACMGTCDELPEGVVCLVLNLPIELVHLLAYL